MYSSYRISIDSIIKLISIIVLPCAFPLALLAQPDEVPFRQLKSGVETPATFAKFVFKDQQGYVWLGSDQGLARFNGQTLERFSSTQGLVGLAVTSPFLEDTTNHLLWFSTDRALHCYRQDSQDFKSVQVYGALEKPQLFFQDASHGLWVRTSTGKVIILEPSVTFLDEPKRFRQIPVGNIEGTIVYVGTDPTDHRVTYLLSAHSSDTKLQGLRYYTFANGQLQLQAPLKKLDRETIVKILPFDSTSVWLVCSDKLIFYDFRKNKKIRVLPFAQFQALDAIWYDSTSLLLATTEGIYRYRDGSIDLLYKSDPQRSDRLREDRIQQLYLDQDSILWVSHWKGVDVTNFKKVKFKVLDFSVLNLGSKKDFAPKSIVELPGERFWFGSNFVGELREMRASGQIRSINLPQPHRNFAADLMYPLRKGPILLSNTDKRSYWYQNNIFLPIYQNSKALPFSTFCQLNNDTILGGNESGLFIIHKNRKNVTATLLNTPLKNVQTVVQDRAGRVLVGYEEQRSSGGLCKVFPNFYYKFFTS